MITGLLFNFCTNALLYMDNYDIGLGWYKLQIILCGITINSEVLVVDRKNNLVLKVKFR